MSLPPLLFRGEGKLDHWQPVSLGVRSEPSEGGPPTRFPRALCGCLDSPLTSLDCFCGVCCCCGPITWNNVMRLVNVDASAAASAALVSMYAKDNQGNQTALGQAAGCLAAFASADVRQQLIRTLYPSTYTEGHCRSLCYHACCPVCVWAQEIDAVAAHLNATHGVTLRYGPTTSCLCTQLVSVDNPYQTYVPPIGLVAPRNQQMMRPNLLGLSHNALDGDNGYYKQP